MLLWVSSSLSATVQWEMMRFAAAILDGDGVEDKLSGGTYDDEMTL